MRTARHVSRMPLTAGHIPPKRVTWEEVERLREIAREAYADHTAFDPDDKHFDDKSDPENPRWFMVDIRFVRKLPRTVPLDELKAEKALAGMVVTTRSRLSVQPVEKQHFEHVLRLAGT